MDTKSHGVEAPYSVLSASRGSAAMSDAADPERPKIQHVARERPDSFAALRLKEVAQKWHNTLNSAVDGPVCLLKLLIHKWARLDSNQRPRDYESPALTD